MNYGLSIAGDARADLHSIDVWLQEEVWDELELLASDPSLLAPLTLEGIISQGSLERSNIP